MSKLKVILELAWPIVVNLIMNTLVMFTDLYVVSKFGADAISGVGVVQNVWRVLFALTIVFSSGGQVLVTRYVGEKSYKKASLVISSLFIVAIASSLLFIVLFAFLPKFILWIMGIDGKVLEYAIEFGYILLLGIPFIFINSVLDMALHSYSNSKMPMFLAIIAALLNVLLDFGLGLGYFGMPNMGVFGVALATVISYAVVACLHLYLYFGKKMPYIPLLRFRRRISKRAMIVAYPEIGSRLLANMSHLIFTSALLSLGSLYYAAFNIAIQIMAIGYMPAIAFASAGAILIGQEIGAKRFDMAKSYIDTIAKLNFLFMLLLALLFIVYKVELATLFSSESKSVKIVVESIVVFAIVHLPFAIDITYTFALNGAGLTKKTFKINMITLWIFKIVPSLYGIYILGSYEWVLASYFIQFIVVAYFMHKEFAKEEWRYLKV